MFNVLIAGALCFVFKLNTSYAWNPLSSRTFEVARSRFLPRPLPADPKKFLPCEASFVNMLSHRLPPELFGNTQVNLWDELFEPDFLAGYLGGLGSETERWNFLQDLINYVDDLSGDPLKVYMENLSSLVTKLAKENKISESTLRRVFIEREFENVTFFWSQRYRILQAQINIPQRKLDIVAGFLNSQGLSPAITEEYRTILLHSNLTEAQIKFAIDRGGMRLVDNPQHLDQFRQYIDFLNFSQAHKVERGLRDIQRIYDFEYRHSLTSLDPIRRPYKQFLIQKSRLNQYERRRYKELIETFKLESRTEITQQLDDLMNRHFQGEDIDMRLYQGLQRRLQNLNLDPIFLSRARNTAQGQREIYRRLLNQCNSGDSPRLRFAGEKFKKFKYAMGLGVPITVYTYRHLDDIGTDPDFAAKWLYEFTSGFAFSWLANKIFTNTSTSFWRKYATGLVQYGSLDFAFTNALYEPLFGSQSYARRIQRFFNPDAPEPELEQKMREMIQSENFEQEYNELVSYLEQKESEFRLKNVLDDVFNLDTEFSDDDRRRLTKEDLESEDAKEFLLEMLAERLYYQDMGSWPILQTGTPGMDRWLFYRGRNVIWDLKSTAINLMTFQLICREPFGKVGSFGAAITMVLADQFLLGDLTVGLRQRAVNQ